MKSFAHPTSATFAKDFSDQTNNSSRLYPDSVGAWRPLREPSPTPHAKSAKASMQERFSKFPFRKFRIPHFAFPNQITPSRLYPDSVGAWRPLREQSAFSLTEVVIAMGVAAVAFTSIIALFPLGLNMSRESYEETQAALLAQTILSDLRDKVSGASTDLRLIQIGPDNSPTNGITKNNYIAVDTSTTYLAPITCYVAYNQETRTDTLYRDVELRPFEGSLSKPSWWDTGNPKATTLAMITVSATMRPDDSATPTNPVQDNPQRVDVYIESPGNLPAASRKQFPFTGGVAP